ncbi:hypothetical protein D9757_007772 [Collybiopsis confluens]|uniref:Uncharacterized protein n=1 Tax=Collybiopsis confluens TaxID=2823264 RepID=A0A8H5MB50_9AGAR|nr:hypothetical protein D9757_007772 [Collybiopsis confluens]
MSSRPTPLYRHRDRAIDTLALAISFFLAHAPPPAASAASPRPSDLPRFITFAPADAPAHICLCTAIETEQFLCTVPTLLSPISKFSIDVREQQQKWETAASDGGDRRGPDKLQQKLDRLPAPSLCHLHSWTLETAPTSMQTTLTKNASDSGPPFLPFFLPLHRQQDQELHPLRFALPRTPYTMSDWAPLSLVSEEGRRWMKELLGY